MGLGYRVSNAICSRPLMQDWQWEQHWTCRSKPCRSKPAALQFCDCNCASGREHRERPRKTHRMLSFTRRTAVRTRSRSSKLNAQALVHSCHYKTNVAAVMLAVTYGSKATLNTKTSSQNESTPHIRHAQLVPQEAREFLTLPTEVPKPSTATGGRTPHSPRKAHSPPYEHSILYTCPR